MISSTRAVSTKFATLAALCVLGVLGLLSSPSMADTLALRDGERIEGRLRSVNENEVVMRTAQGDRRIPRTEVASIVFSPRDAPPPAPPLKVEIRNVRSDDAIDVLLDDTVVLHDAREGGDWIDLTPRLKEGNNPLRLRIRNDHATWAYRVSLRINGRVSTLACGTPHRTDGPCTCCGKTGREIGIVDDIPVVWLYVDRAKGLAEVVP